MDRTEVDSLGTENIIRTNLCSRYSFDNFVLCDANMLAYSAAKALVAGEKRFNPFCIVGSSGNGKTHLLQAIGNAIVQQDSEKKVLYSATEEFVNDVLQGVRSGKLGAMESLREKYRTPDILLLDDFDFIEGKNMCATELMHSIDFMQREGSQIVLTSSKRPGEIEDINAHLYNLISEGLVVEMSTPDQAMKESIVREKAKEAGVLLRDEVIEYISGNCHSNISEIEGAIKSIVAYSELAKPVISLDAAKGVLKAIMPES